MDGNERGRLHGSGEDSHARPANEIGSNDIKDNSVNTFDVHSFLGVDVVDETLTGADVGDATLTGAQWRVFNPGSATVKICNPTTAAIDDGSTTINLLVIDAN